MTDRTASDTATRTAAGDDGSRYGAVAISLHWATAALVLFQFVSAETWDWLPKPTRQSIESLHISFGVVLTAVVVLRLVWRWIPGHQMSSLETGWVRIVSTGTHYLLYALLVVQSALGFGFRWGQGHPVGFFGLGISGPYGELARPLRRQLHELHEWVGWGIVIVALGHALGALYHHYALKDRVLERMLPGNAAR